MYSKFGLWWKLAHKRADQYIALWTKKIPKCTMYMYGEIFKSDKAKHIL